MATVMRTLWPLVVRLALCAQASGGLFGATDGDPGAGPPPALVPRYVQCMRGAYGASCDQTCQCGAAFDCDDGPSGRGGCYCKLGRSAACAKDASTVDATAPGLVVGTALLFGNRTLRSLDVDLDTSRGSRQVYGSSSVSRVLPFPFHSRRTRVAAVDGAVARMLRVDAAALKGGRNNLSSVLSGHRWAATAQPFAHRYAGHQFGNYPGQLGDGRAISLGEVRAWRGDGAQAPAEWWELSLKGAGRTPYSRAGDGRAVLVAAFRELLGSAALNAVGVPTTRCLCVVAGDAAVDGVYRDEFYDGGGKLHTPGIVTRKCSAVDLPRHGSMLSVPARHLFLRLTCGKLTL